MIMKWYKLLLVLDIGQMLNVMLWLFKEEKFTFSFYPVP